MDLQSSPAKPGFDTQWLMKPSLRSPTVVSGARPRAPRGRFPDILAGFTSARNADFKCAIRCPIVGYRGKFFAGCPIVTECLWMGDKAGFASELTLAQTPATDNSS